MKLSNILKELRIEKKLKQDEVAKIINKTSVAYGYYESGRNEPDLKTMIILADFYGVSLDYLCGRQYNNNVGYIPDERKDTVKKIISLEDMKFQKVDGYVDSLINN